MKKILTSSVVVIVFLTGCSTTYHSQGFFGGYSEIQTNPDSFIVLFKGNRYTSSEKVMKYVLLRASELTIQNGYKYFVVLDSSDQSSGYQYSNTYTRASASASSYNCYNYSNTRVRGSESSNTYSGTVIKPGTSIRIKCFMEDPLHEDSINAEFYQNVNKPL
ncbi:MAG: hypothetical protein V4489_06810 [Chlamydiota bacterium]